MNELRRKQLQRLEKKKKKIAALVEITRLNDKDREAKQLSKQIANTNTSCKGKNINNMTEENLHRKRTCDNEDIVHQGIPKKEESSSDESDKSEIKKKPRLDDDDEYRDLKQELRERKKKLTKIPRFSLTSLGENASLLKYLKCEDRIPIFIHDVQHLLLFSLLGNYSPYVPSRWCRLEKHNKINHTIVFVIEGLCLYHFMAYESIFSHITNNFKHHLEVITPIACGASIAEELAAVPLTGTQSDKLIQQYGSLETALQATGDVIRLLGTVFPMCPTNCNTKSSKRKHKNLPSTDKFSRTKLLLSLSQMVQENYPVPVKGQLIKTYKRYVLTKDVYEEATAMSPMFGIDCEMCKTASGDLELTRVTIVNENMKVIYDSLVKPKYKITDYLTRYSGITEEMMKDVTVTLRDVQETLRTLLPSDAILVGQSLNCDLHTLKMMHPYVIDTSVIFNITGERGKKTRLQTLAREFLGERIQESKSGHCSAEDSKASLKLVQLKLANSVDYGDAVLLGTSGLEILMQEQNKTSLRTLQKMESKKYATSIFRHVAKNKKTAAIVGNKEIMAEYSKYLNSSSLNVMDDKNFAENDQVRLVITNGNEYTINRTCEIITEHAFILCHVRIGEDQLKDEQLDTTFSTVNEWVHKLWQHMAINDFACVIFSGQNKATNGVCFLDIKNEETMSKDNI